MRILSEWWDSVNTCRSQAEIADTAGSDSELCRCLRSERILTPIFASQSAEAMLLRVSDAVTTAAYLQAETLCPQRQRVFRAL
jgi:hypothetical protein